VARRRIDRDPAPEDVDQLTMVPFAPSGDVALPSDLTLPSGRLEPGQHYLDSLLAILIPKAQFRSQRFHPFAIDGAHVYAWVDGSPLADAELVIEPAEAVADRLRRAGRDDEAFVIEEAADSFRNQNEESYHADNVRALERAYLQATTVEGGSGFGRDAAAWRAARSMVVDGLAGDGTFLDMGCANGLLVESVVAWAAERGLSIEGYGVDIAPKLVELAQQRLPHWKDRFWVGNAMTWVHPDGMHFDHVHALLDFVPVNRRAAMLQHLLDDVVARGGRLLVSQYGSSRAVPLPPAGDVVADLGFDVAGWSQPKDPPYSGAANTAWIVNP
jgi:hypothetical protein